MTKLLDLTKPADCRWYIDHFPLVAGRRVTEVHLSSGRRIRFDAMTDDDAVLVANQLYEMEQEGAARARRGSAH